MESSHSYSPTWGDVPSRVQTPLVGSHFATWNSRALDSFDDASPTSASYPTTPTPRGSSSNAQNPPSIYYGTFGQQALPYSVPHPFHGMPVQPSYFQVNQSMGYTPVLPRPLQDAHSTILNTPQAAPSTASANQKKRAATTDGAGARKKRKKAPEVPATTELSGSATSPHCGVGPSPVSMPPPSDSPLALSHEPIPVPQTPGTSRL